VAEFRAGEACEARPVVTDRRLNAVVGQPLEWARRVWTSPASRAIVPANCCTLRALFAQAGAENKLLCRLVPAGCLHDAFGVLGVIFRKLGWKAPIFYWRAAPNTPTTPQARRAAGEAVLYLYKVEQSEA
jgi:hypothetical protein